MTELYIDGVAAVLSKDFNIQVKRENPLFTKNGEYTYDITLPLDNPTNAELYGHLNRLNVTQAVGTDRRAVLVADNRVYCNGTEVITGWTENTVSIQIASGNSELNWIIGADLQISFLDKMPETPALTELDVWNITRQTYPETQFNLPPVYDKTTGTCVNPYWVDKRLASYLYYPEKTESGELMNFFPQPYLCAYIRAVLVAVGYTVEYLFLEDTDYKDLLICHAVQSRNWKDFLPGWSVKDFLEQVELMFNATVVVDNRNRTVRVMNRNSFYAGQQTVHVTEVEDAYEAERADEDDEPETTELMQCNVRYAFADTAYGNEVDLPEGALSSAIRQVIGSDYQPDLSVAARMQLWLEDETHQDLSTIYIDERTGEMAYIYEISAPTIPGAQFPPMPLWHFMDMFHRIERDDAAQDVELKMTPAVLGDSAALRSQITLPDGEDTWSTYSQYTAMVETGSGESTTPGDKTVSEILSSSTSGSSEESSSGGNISVAFYGLLDQNDLVNIEPGHEFYFPCVFTSPYHYTQYAYYDVPVYTNSTGLSLSLERLQEQLWTGSYDINQEDAIKISSHDPNLYDARYIFEIRNKRYVCREMEFTLDANGRKGAWTGTFYPIKISDTEADARWILTDGRWRDGGVWLDNGRWLDDPT